MKKPGKKLDEKDQIEIKKIMEKRRSYILKAQPKKALALIKKSLKKYPGHLLLEADYAVSVGDMEEGRSASQRKKQHQLAAKLLKKVLHRMRGQDLSFRTRTRNEYYWFSGQPQKQYQLGVEMVSKGFKRSYYSQGVGAVMVSTNYRMENKKGMSLRWAKKAETAWKQYFKFNPNYYNGYCWYARALGLQGKFGEMEQALNMASKLSGRPKSYYEFKEVRGDIKRLFEDHP